VSTKAVVGIYESLAKAEKAEFLLEEVHLPVGQMSLFAPRMEAGEVEGDITARSVADAVADTGVRFDKGQIEEYERVLKEGRALLIFHGDSGEVARAHRALEDSDNEELTIVGG
jgi:hypothetical protein